MKKHASSFTIYIVIFLMIMTFAIFSKNNYQESQVDQYTYSDLVNDILYNDNIESIELTNNKETSNTGTATVTFNDGSPQKVVHIPAFDVFMTYCNQAIAEDGLQVSYYPPPKTSFLMSLIPTIIILLLISGVFIFIMQQVQGGGGNKVLSFGKSKAKVQMDPRSITFEDVAGLEEEKTELYEVVEFLKNPKKFTDIGARIPKGVMLFGPPGTGKTYLARAVAGEAGVPFFSISGSDFVEMFVGVGASRVRDLFEQAKKNSPCIVFIDEIDAVGRRRGAGLGGGHDEREQTLNQLLVEMDGFTKNEGVIIMAATNRPDVLDPALLRPGRFDRQIVVSRPDVIERHLMLELHCRNKKIGPDVDLKTIAHTTSGFTPADLENLLNESALLAARENKTEIDMDDVRRAFIKLGVGTEKKGRSINERERKITAYHEAGHAIIHELLTEVDPTFIISIVPTGSAGGYTMSLPGEDKLYVTKTYMQQEIVVLLAGRAAEAIVIGDITTGASNDIERATAFARSMVTKFGMSDKLGPIQYGEDKDEVFLGKDLAHTRNYGENIAATIDSEIHDIITTSYQNAYDLLQSNIQILHDVANLLLEKEKVTGMEVRALFPEGALADKLANRAKSAFDDAYTKRLKESIDKAAKDRLDRAKAEHEARLGPRTGGEVNENTENPEAIETAETSERSGTAEATETSKTIVTAGTSGTNETDENTKTAETSGQIGTSEQTGTAEQTRTDETFGTSETTGKNETEVSVPQNDDEIENLSDDSNNSEE